MLIGIVATINMVAFLVMAHDKRTAVRGHNANRAPEGFIFFLATMFGGIGVYLGMLTFRHKTKKWYFQIGIPVLIVQNLATIYVIWAVIRSF
ncbi:MAG: DUF1294 domain-containing protein [Candidatus Moranbacteria bacterium]|nr:DUF1294 domain-containing protein [Candidatus Moranbacteria bacterium]